MPAAAPILAGLAVYGGGYGAALAFAAAAATAIAMKGLSQSADLNDRGHQVNTRSTEETLPLIYGRSRVGINQVYVGTSGSDNQYLHMVGAVGEGPVSGIVQENGIDQVFLDGTLAYEYGDLVHYEFFTGAADQAVCDTLRAAIPDWNDRLPYTAYIYLRIKYSSEAFTAIPSVEVLLDGLLVTDPDTETTAYSNNAALCAYDFITRPSTRGGMGIGTARIVTSTVAEARDYCAAKGWTANLPIGDDQAAVDNLQLILDCFRGALIYSTDLFKLRFRDLSYESPVMTLTDADVVDGTLRLTQSDGLGRPNALRVKFLNSELGYQADDAIISDAAAQTADGDYREEEVDLYGLTTREKAREGGYYYLERMRWSKGVSLEAANRAWALEPLDLILLTHELPGWTARLCRVEAATVNPDFTAALTLVEEDAILYDAAYNLSEEQWHDTTLPDPNAPVPSVYNVSEQEESYWFRDRSFTRWKINFDPPPETIYPWWDYAEVWLRLESPGVARDASGNNFHGMVVDGGSGDAGFVTGLSGKCFQANGVDSWIVVADDTGLDPGSFFTLSCLFNPSSLAPASMYLAGKSTLMGAGASGEFGLHVATSGANRVPAAHINETELLGTTALETGEWYAVTATYDGATLALYVNGVLENSVAVGAVVLDNALDFTMCADANEAHLYAGMIDEVQLHSRVRTSDEIVRYAATFGLVEEG